MREEGREKERKVRKEMTDVHVLRLRILARKGRSPKKPGGKTILMLWEGNLGITKVVELELFQLITDVSKCNCLTVIGFRP